MKHETKEQRKIAMLSHRFIIHSFILLSLLFLSGCMAIGAIAHAIPETHKAAYGGLAGQSVGVMVWADRAIRIDWPSIQLDLASRIQDDLHRSDAPEVKGTTWTIAPASIVKYQHDHPEIEFMSVTDVAPKLGVTRLIYVEVQSMTTRSDVSLQTFRGGIACSVKVVEVDPGLHTSKLGYEEAGIRAIFPPKSPPEGVINSNDLAIYRGLIPSLSAQIANRLVSYEAD